MFCHIYKFCYLCWWYIYIHVGFLYRLLSGFIYILYYSYNSVVRKGGAAVVIPILQVKKVSERWSDFPKMTKRVGGSHGKFEPLGLSVCPECYPVWRRMTCSLLFLVLPCARTAMQYWNHDGAIPFVSLRAASHETVRRQAPSLKWAVRGKSFQTTGRCDLRSGSHTSLCWVQQVL